MAGTAVALADVKEYLRVEGEHEDALITSLIVAAEQYMAVAGVRPPASGARRALYTLAVCALCLSWHDKRDLVITGTIVADNPALRGIINQLKCSEPPVSNSDTGEGKA